jgi:hypothetical protein
VFVEAGVKQRCDLVQRFVSPGSINEEEFLVHGFGSGRMRFVPGLILSAGSNGADVGLQRRHQHRVRVPGR